MTHSRDGDSTDYSKTIAPSSVSFRGQLHSSTYRAGKIRCYVGRIDSSSVIQLE